MLSIGMGRGGVGREGGGTPQRAVKFFFDPVVVFVITEAPWIQNEYGGRIHLPSIPLESLESVGVP